MGNLTQEIERLRAMGTAHDLNERMVQTARVLPLLRELGWDTTDPDEVSLEHPVGGHLRGSADIVLMSREKPLVLIETKAPRLTLNDEKHLRQLSDYCRMLEAEIGVLTNGIEWRFYLSGSGTSTPELAEKINLEIDDAGICGTKMQNLLSRDKVSDEGAQTFARQAFLQRTFVKEWMNLLDTADSTISKRLRKAVKESTNNAGIKVTTQELSRIEPFIKQQAQNIRSGVESARPSFVQTVAEDRPAPSGDLHTPKPREGNPQKPTHIEVWGQRFEVKNWRNVLRTFSDEAYRRDSSLFNAALKNEGKARPLFVRSATKPEDMRAPHQIGTSDLWVETYASASGILDKCRKIQRLFGWAEDTLRIYLGERLL